MLEMMEGPRGAQQREPVLLYSSVFASRRREFAAGAWMVQVLRSPDWRARFSVVSPRRLRLRRNAALQRLAFTLAERYIAEAKLCSTDERERQMAKPTTKTVSPAAKKNQRSTLLYRVTLPDDVEKRRIRKTRRDEIAQLRDIAGEVFFGQDRFKERAFLAAAYDLYRSWLKDGREKIRAADVIKMFKPGVRGTAHPITVILAAAFTTQDKKIRSKWSLALQYASQNDVRPEELSSFMDQNGGMAGCAQQFARLNRTKRGVSNKKRKVAPRKK